MAHIWYTLHIIIWYTLHIILLQQLKNRTNLKENLLKSVPVFPLCVDISIKI